MAKILLVTSGLRGILNASFELVNRLAKDGHEITYASPRKVGVDVSAQNIRFIPLPEIDLHFKESLPNYKGPLKKLKRFWYKLQHQKTRCAKALEQIQPNTFNHLLETKGFDLLILDVELHEYIFKAYAKKIPLLLLSQWFSIWNRTGLPYLLTDTIPGKGWRGQGIAIALSWRWIKIKRWFTFTKQKMYTLGTDRRSTLLNLAKAENFPLQFIKENYWPGPFTYDELPVLSMTAKEMEFPHEHRPNHFYIGPMVAENRVAVSFDNKALDAVFEYQKKHQAALIYCSVSTLKKGDATFLNKVIQAVKSQEKWVLVIGMGGLLNTKDFGQFPENVFAFSYVPQLQVLSKAACSINHGGIHTINECIHFKVPMLIYSGKKSDQNGCAARVAYHKLGIMADKDQDDSAGIRMKINEVLTNSVYRRNMEDLYQEYLNYKEECFVERIINSFLTPTKINKL